MIHHPHLFLLLVFSSLSSTGLNAQHFQKVTNPENELAQHGPGAGAYTGVCWMDYNGDGFSDCFINSNNLYRNEGNGSFTKLDFSGTIPGLGNGSSWGDNDNDGDLDVFVSSAVTGGLGLYQNLGNGNHWIQLELEGTSSNRDAIGSRLELLATLDGRAQWQIRKVNGQDSFAGHNDLRIYFGLGGATSIDSLIVYWPSG